jgi:hypothetical protein
MKKSRLRGLEKAVGKLGGGRCRVCGHRPWDPVQPLIVHRNTGGLFEPRPQSCDACGFRQPVVVFRGFAPDSTAPTTEEGEGSS